MSMHAVPWNSGRVYVIAEAGVNHNGSLEQAVKLVRAAAAAGADAVKFQAFRADALVTPQALKAAYQKERTGDKESQLEMLSRYQLSEADFRLIAEEAVRCGLDFICTPFDRESADLLATLPLAAYKISSGELTNHPLLHHIACKGRPVILSTGMASLGEIEEAIKVIQAAGAVHLALLHCTSNYPVADDEVNLRVMNTLSRAFGLPTGFSDHTLGNEIAVAAVALGASIVEKHFTLDKSLPGPDHAMSLSPEELVTMVQAVRRVERALGSAIKRVTQGEEDVRRVARRSVCTARAVRAGEKLTPEMLDLKRPGDGIAPSLLGLVVGRVVRRDLPSGTLLSWEDFQ